jgi:hypothetical protein
MSSDDVRRIYRPTLKLRLPPPNLTPEQQASFTRHRVIENFVKDFFAALPRDMNFSATELVHYANFAKQVWRFKDEIRNSTKRDLKINLKVGHWSEIIGLKEPILRRLAAEVLKTELAVGGW